MPLEELRLQPRRVFRGRRRLVSCQPKEISEEEISLRKGMPDSEHLRLRPRKTFLG